MTELNGVEVAGIRHARKVDIVPHLIMGQANLLLFDKPRTPCVALVFTDHAEEQFVMGVRFFSGVFVEHKGAENIVPFAEAGVSSKRVIMSLKGLPDLGMDKAVIGGLEVVVVRIGCRETGRVFWVNYPYTEFRVFTPEAFSRVCDANMTGDACLQPTIH